MKLKSTRSLFKANYIGSDLPKVLFFPILSSQVTHSVLPQFQKFILSWLVCCFKNEINTEFLCVNFFFWLGGFFLWTFISIHIHQNYLSHYYWEREIQWNMPLKITWESNKMLMWVSCCTSKHYTRQLIVLNVPY